MDYEQTNGNANELHELPDEPNSKPQVSENNNSQKKFATSDPESAEAQTDEPKNIIATPKTAIIGM